MYELVFILSVSLVAVLAGASNFRQVADQVADFPQSLLAKPGGKWCYFRGVFGWPSEPTIRRALEDIDAGGLDRLIGMWPRERARPDSDDMLVLAIDGKVLRGARTGDNDTFTLFSAMIHGVGVTVAQVRIPDGTNEITQVETLLAGVPAADEERVVVTMDAAHTQRDTADHVVAGRGFDYVMTVKGKPANITEISVREMSSADARKVGPCGKGRGQVSQWSTWVTDATGIDFPHVRQVACIRREVFTLAGARITKEHAWTVAGGGDNHLEAAPIYITMSENIGESTTKATTCATPPDMKTHTKPTQEAGGKSWRH